MTVIAVAPKARALVLSLLSVLFGLSAFGQMDTATISGYITDQSSALITGAAITLINVETNTFVTQSSNGSGLYVCTNVKPGRYRLIVEKAKFRKIALTDLQVDVQDLLSRNFKLQVGVVG